MIYGKLWLVVKPTVGIPLFLSAVAIGSFAVHVAQLPHTTWVKRVLNGKEVAVATVDAPAPAAAPAKK
ncbi:MAG: light-harvesting protein [Betaproteobacteria bacterium]